MPNHPEKQGDPILAAMLKERVALQIRIDVYQDVSLEQRLDEVERTIRAYVTTYPLRR